MANSGTNPTGNNYSVRCADVGDRTCQWQATAGNETELMQKVEQHGREKHNLTSFTEEMKNKVRNAIRRVAA